jgi:hypothetical protein
MRSRIAGVSLLAGVLLAAGACATSEEWSEWLKHPTHFASDQHMGFSLRHTEGSKPRIARRDIEASRKETWWGKAITVSPEQIFEN